MIKLIKHLTKKIDMVLGGSAKAQKNLTYSEVTSIPIDISEISQKVKPKFLIQQLKTGQPTDNCSCYVFNINNNDDLIRFVEPVFFNKSNTKWPNKLSPDFYIEVDEFYNCLKRAHKQQITQSQLLA